MKLMKFVASVFAFTVLSLSSYAQDKKATILTVQGENVTKEEFENIFRKNNRDSVINEKALDDYMELFINFKLKVREARDLGMDTVQKFKSELDGYRQTLARPYLTDGAMLDVMVKEAYDRMNYEVRAAHILVKCESNASPEDSLKAFNKIMEIRNKILAGADFSTIAKQSSEDPSAKENAGDLGYFTAFQMVYQFEDAAFNTPTGQLSMPVRTRYGYHILKVSDKRPARGEVRVAHILVKEKKEDNGAENARLKAQEIYQKAKSGESFTELASKFSEDASSAKSGGELPWFGTNKMVSEFEEASFALKNDGDVSEPFKTSYGWHIVKRLGHRGLGTFTEMEKEIKAKVSKDNRSERTRSSFINKLKKDYNFSYNPALLNAIAAKADTAVFNGKWNLKKKELKKTLFTIDGKAFKVADLHKVITSKMKIKTKFTPSQYIVDEGEHFMEVSLLKHEDAKLEQKYDAFRLLMNEYREGILLFELTDQKVWTKAVKDTIGLQNFYEKNQARFMWPERLDVTLYTCGNEAMAQKVRELIAKGTDNASIALEVNKDSQLNLQIEEGVFSEEDRDVLANVARKTGLSTNIPFNGQIVIANVKAIIPPSPKKLSEARGLITSEYQNYLEQQWIAELRKKYTYKKNSEVLHSIK